LIFNLLLDQIYQVDKAEDKVEPILHVGLDEGAGVDDLDILRLVDHHSLLIVILLPPLHLQQVGDSSLKWLVCLSNLVHPFALLVSKQLNLIC